MTSLPRIRSMRDNPFRTVDWSAPQGTDDSPRVFSRLNGLETWPANPYPSWKDLAKKNVLLSVTPQEIPSVRAARNDAELCSSEETLWDCASELPPVGPVSRSSAEPVLRSAAERETGSATLSAVEACVLRDMFIAQAIATNEAVDDLVTENEAAQRHVETEAQRRIETLNKLLDEKEAKLTAAEEKNAVLQSALDVAKKAAQGSAPSPQQQMVAQQLAQIQSLAQLVAASAATATLMLGSSAN